MAEYKRKGNGGGFFVGEDAAALLRRWYEEGWNERNFEVFREILAPQFVLHQVFDKTDVTELDEVEKGAERLIEACSALRFSIEAIIGEENSAAIRYRIAGRRKRSGREFNVAAMAFANFDESDKLVEAWNCSDLPYAPDASPGGASSDG